MAIERLPVQLQNPDKPVTWQMFRIVPYNHILQFARLNDALKKADRLERWVRIDRTDRDFVFGYGLWNLKTITELINKKEKINGNYRLPVNEYNMNIVIGDRQTNSCKVDKEVVAILIKEKVFEKYGLGENEWEIKAPFLLNVANFFKYQSSASYQVLGTTRKIDNDNRRVWLDMTIGRSLL